VKRHDIRQFKSKNHDVKTIVVNKLSLGYKDDKRQVLENKIDTLPYGHYSMLSYFNSK